MDDKKSLEYLAVDLVRVCKEGGYIVGIEDVKKLVELVKQHKFNASDSYLSKMRVVRSMVEAFMLGFKNVNDI